jgi:NAD(P)H-dependent flavin oxidoreductase YrpB (nitropropane dioxygenase family)
MPFNTALTRKLGIKVPVVQGGEWHSESPEMAYSY